MTLVQHQYYSVRVAEDGEEEDYGQLFIQVLSLKVRAEIVETVSIREKEDVESFVVHAQILQPLADDEVHTDFVDTYPIQDPGPLDLFEFLDSSLQSRQKLRHWKTKESNVEECLTLYEPTIATP
eukprot:8317043-Pyramimonas_sp.AAC.1